VAAQKLQRAVDALDRYLSRFKRLHPRYIRIEPLVAKAHMAPVLIVKIF
jgi:hypothetical protein